MVEDLIKRHMERLPTCARLYYSGIGNRRYKRASTQSGPGEPLVFKDLAERELRALESELRGDLEAANARITALQSERDALVNSVAAGGKEAVAYVRATDLEDLKDKRIAGKGCFLNKDPRDGFVAIYTATTAALENGDGRDAWISVDDRLPKCSRAKGSLGVEVLVWPLTESGEATAFYGRRVTDTPAFYRYGAVINRITHWQPLPSPPAGLSQKTGE